VGGTEVNKNVALNTLKMTAEERASVGKKKGNSSRRTGGRGGEEVRVINDPYPDESGENRLTGRCLSRSKIWRSKAAVGPCRDKAAGGRGKGDHYLFSLYALGLWGHFYQSLRGSRGSGDAQPFKGK